MNTYTPVKTTLYHGTSQKIDKIDVSFGRGYKDFGKGFYLTTDKEQAIGMMNSKYRKEVRRGVKGVSKHLYKVEFNKDILKTLNVKVFEQANEEWLDFILMCRKSPETPHNYDLVIGPTAHDDITTSFRQYESGKYDKFENPKKALIISLEAENLGTQYFIGKQNVVDSLILSVEEIDWRD